jgi:Tripartite tricarboxylate transporter family receptor
LVGWLKANQASAGIIAGDFRLITMFFQRQISATLTLVPYRGGAPAVQDLAAGQIDILIATPLYLPLVRAGRATFAEAPATFTEIGLPALSYYQWTGLFAPRGTPEDIISKLNKAAIEALANPAVRSRLAERNKPGRSAPLSCGFRQRADLDLEAELGDLGSQAFGFDLDRVAVEVVGAEILVFGAVLQHVVDCGEHRGGHGTDRFLRAVPAIDTVELCLV